jgi:hypothetical protein
MLRNPYYVTCNFPLLHERLMSDSNSDLNAFLEPGMLVTHPAQPDWGLGQVQSNIRGKITVNFREAGKVVIDGSRVLLLPATET